jgi:membrane protease YdiL (CAAX protease family)
MAEESPLKDPHFDVRRVLFLYAVLLVTFVLVRGVRESIPASRITSNLWAYDSAASILIVLCIALTVRPRLLALSRWMPTWKDAIIGSVAGAVAGGVPLLFVAELPPVSLYLAVPVLLVAPFLEEILFRGIFQKSLGAHLDNWLAIPIVLLMAALVHQNFWWALCSQTVLCLVYGARNNSLGAAMICHFCANATVFLLAGTVPRMT